MSEIAVSVRDLGKLYHIGRRLESYRTLRDSVAGSLRRLRARGSSADADPTIWALRGVSFDVPQGEVVGVIGRNGAGKSTLLKILTRITEPTEGCVELRGRVGSLLEVGTGFHPELTGRENIYLNGAILGMRKTEIDRKFDEIVAFAEIEKFLDTPVKRYSSGMYVRLAFAVAAHLEPEILLVDEVLAVGDAAFQKKCLGKMGEVAAEGRTVLFVSHNMAAVQGLCNQCILLEAGQMRAKLPTHEAVALYLRQIATGNGTVPAGTAGIVNVKALGFARPGGLPGEFHFSTEEAFELCFDYELLEPLREVRVGIWFMTPAGHTFMAAFDTDSRPELLSERAAGCYRSRMLVPPGFLNAGEYTVRVLVYVHRGKVYLDDSALFLQLTDPADESAQTGLGFRVGQLVPRFAWDVDYGP